MVTFVAVTILVKLKDVELPSSSHVQLFPSASVPKTVPFVEFPSVPFVPVPFPSGSQSSSEELNIEQSHSDAFAST